jgi:hypothetical protein
MASAINFYINNENFEKQPFIPAFASLKDSCQLIKFYQLEQRQSLSLLGN